MVSVDRVIFINVISVLIVHERPHISQHVALVAFELQAVVTALLHDQFTGLSLAMQSISRDGDATDIKHLDQFAQRQDLAAALGALRYPER